MVGGGLCVQRQTVGTGHRKAEEDWVMHKTSTCFLSAAPGDADSA